MFSKEALTRIFLLLGSSTRGVGPCFLFSLLNVK